MSQILDFLRRDGILPNDICARNFFKTLLGIEHSRKERRWLDRYLQDRYAQRFVYEGQPPDRMLRPRLPNGEPDRWSGLDFTRPWLIEATDDEKRSLREWLAQNPTMQEVLAQLRFRHQMPMLRMMLDEQMRQGTLTQPPQWMTQRRPAELACLMFNLFAPPPDSKTTDSVMNDNNNNDNIDDS
jgi:hypothetical protein